MVYLSLGSNIGNRYQHLQKAITLLSEHLQNIAQSSVYETKPWGLSNQNEFLNTAISAETKLSPTELLTFTQSVQDKIGRMKTMINGPRTIDIDIIFYNQDIVQIPQLIIPHARAHERDFVLTPICELDPYFNHPVFNKSVSELMAEVPERYVVSKHKPLVF